MEALRAAQPREIFLVQDGPRASHPDDELGCSEARAIAENIDWECTIHRVYSPDNLGVRARFFTGLDEVFEMVDSAIILEDDCLPDPSFFPYCHELLERYAEDDRVGMISGNNFLRGEDVSTDSYFFTPDTRIWGWATWRRVWQEFSSAEANRTWDDGSRTEAISRLHSPIRRKAMTRMTGNNASVDSWGVSFVLHNLQRGYLNITPEVNVVRNIGFGAQSTHTTFHSFTDDIAAGVLTFPLRHPTDVADTPEAGMVEARAHRRLWITFPLTHPIDFARRVFGYLWHRLTH